MVILLLGRQGTGKTTLGRGLARTLSGTFYSGGALIRQEIAVGSDRGLRMRAPMASGDGVSPDDAFAVLEAAVARHSGGPLILDGYPRKRSEADRLGALVGEPNKVFVLEVQAREILVDRIRTRVECPNCYATFGPGAPSNRGARCEFCGWRLVKRPEDDDARKILKRHEFWRRHGPPIVAHYRELGLTTFLDAAHPPGAILARALTDLRSLQTSPRK